MNEREKLRSESLNLLRFPLAVVVLTIHVFSSQGLKLQGQEISFDSAQIFQEINYFIDGFLRGQSVPIYFFISGYVFFLGITLTRETYKRKLQNRVKTLLIQFLIWNMLALFQWLLYRTPPFEPWFPGINKMELNPTLSGFLNCFWDKNHSILTAVEPPLNNSIMPQDGPLWFLRDLMIVVLSTPIIYWLLKHTRHYLVCLLGLAWFILAYWDLGHPKQILTAFFFFSWGAYMSINQKDMLVEFGKYSRLSVVLYITLSLSYVASVHWLPDASTTIKRLNILVGLLFAYNLAAWLLRRKICRPNAFLASASFFIYVAHMLICRNILKLVFFFTRPTSNFGMLAVYASTVVLTVGILLGAFWLLRRYTPGLLKVIAGRK